MTNPAKVPDSIRETILKVKAPTESDHPGEAAAANVTLARLCAKQGIRPEDLNEESTEIFWFRYADNQDLTLLQCCIAKACGIRKSADCPNGYVKGNQRPGTRRIGFKLTKVQHADAELLFDHYQKLYSEERSVFSRAFLNAQGLALQGSRSYDEMTDEQKRANERASNMALMIDRKNPHRQLGHAASVR